MALTTPPTVDRKTEPVEVCITMALAAMVAGACVGALLIALLSGVTLALMAIGSPPSAEVFGFFVMAVVASLFAWGAGILAAVPGWVVMHLMGLTKPVHAMIFGAVAPGVIGLVVSQSIGFVFAGILGPFVGLTIQRVYYGKAPS